MLLHADLIVSSMPRSIAFYGKLGLKVLDEAMVEGDLPLFLSERRYTALRLVLLRVSPIGSMVELIEFQDWSRTSDEPLEIQPGHNTLTLFVEQLGEAMASLAASGVLPVTNVFEVSLPRTGASAVVYYRDPDGHLIELLARA